MNNFTFESYTEKDTSEIKFTAFYDGKECKLKALEGPLAKRRIALQLIIHDLGDCYKGLCYIMSLKDRQLYMLLYKSFIITYGKCFSTGKRRGLSLDAKDIFKTSPELYKLHCTLIKIRNEYVAHADDNICEFGKIYLASTSSKYQIFTPVTRFSNPINHSLQKEIDLCLFVIKKVEAKINRLERKLIKMQT